MAHLITRTNSRFWYGRWRNGETISMKSTHVPVKGDFIGGIKETTTQARRRAQSIADAYEASDKEGLGNELVREVLSSLAKESIPEIPSVNEYLEGYLFLRRSQLTRNTLYNMRKAYELFTKHLGSRAKLPINTVRRSDVKAFVSEQLQQVRRSTVQKYITALSPAFMNAVDDEIIEKNPFFNTKVPRNVGHEDSCKEAFTPDEVALMLERLPEEWYSMVLFCLCMGGQRLGDVAMLQWNQIDLEAGMISLVTGKTGRRLRIPVIGPLEQHIRAIPHTGRFVHPGCAEKYQRQAGRYLSYQFKVWLQHIGVIARDASTNARGGRTRNVAPKTFHCLRATAATWLHNLGIDHALAKEIVGHDSEASHQLYIRPSDDSRKDALEKLGQAILGSSSRLRCPAPLPAAPSVPRTEKPTAVPFSTATATEWNPGMPSSGAVFVFNAC
ncbi:tyrosine-type recombinase/integrase [Akkermansia glycaniphila]|uniref:Phage integrase family n=1 Tax=Akkermansia glycaniphila TaxID=1679444 RepID=A0A1C7PAK4_9BACT|nr:tyrosine-type recombinase/integrase [Akkermansia glycaniphila]OCA02577.1 hypothetical protein AC781_09625 [Akkermansia glycaniphila]SEH97792.1 phage integrase family [Akkermansia glycaniphila]